MPQGMRYVSRIFHIVGAEEIVYATARLSQRIGDPHSTSVTVYAGSPQFNLVTGEEQGSQKVVLTTHGCISGERCGLGQIDGSGCCDGGDVLRRDVRCADVQDVRAEVWRASKSCSQMDPPPPPIPHPPRPTPPKS